MLLSVLPRFATDLAVRVFPGVQKLLSVYDSLPRMGLPSWEGNIKKRGFQTPGNTLTAESAASLRTTEGT